MRLQLNLENLVTDISMIFRREKKKSVVLCDRGMMDGKAYAGDENWGRLLQFTRNANVYHCERSEAVFPFFMKEYGDFSLPILQADWSQM